MNITAILLAAILAGLGSLNVYVTTHSGGPTSGSVKPADVGGGPVG